MIRDYHYSSGSRNTGLQYTFRTLGRKTPEEVFTGTRPDVSHIRIFGSVCYCHVHADNRKKLDPSREKGLLVGYNEISKAYRVYIFAPKGIIVSRVLSPTL